MGPNYRRRQRIACLASVICLISLTIYTRVVKDREDSREADTIEQIVQPVLVEKDVRENSSPTWYQKRTCKPRSVGELITPRESEHERISANSFTESASSPIRSLR